MILELDEDYLGFKGRIVIRLDGSMTEQGLACHIKVYTNHEADPKSYGDIFLTKEQFSEIVQFVIEDS